MHCNPGSWLLWQHQFFANTWYLAFHNSKCYKSHANVLKRVNEAAEEIQTLATVQPIIQEFIDYLLKENVIRSWIVSKWNQPSDWRRPRTRASREKEREDCEVAATGTIWIWWEHQSVISTITVLIVIFFVVLGKSTTLKRKSMVLLWILCPVLSGMVDFQRLYAPSAFRRDRILWLKIIQLNILRSVRTMIDALSPATSPTSDSETAEMQASSQQALPRDIEQARERLRLLKQVELYLMSELVPETEQEATVLPSLSSGRSSAGTSGKASAGVSSRSQCVKEELFVRPNAQWKNTMVTVSASPPDKGKERTRSHAGSHDFDFSSESPQAILCACYDDIITLWDNTAVRQILKRRKVRMEDFPGLLVFGHCSTPQSDPDLVFWTIWPGSLDWITHLVTPMC